MCGTQHGRQGRRATEVPPPGHGTDRHRNRGRLDRPSRRARFRRPGQAPRVLAHDTARHQRMGGVQRLRGYRRCTQRRRQPSQPDLAGSVTPAPAPAGAPVASGQYFGEQGTAIASLIAGHGHGPAGSSGIIGVAPQARILSVPVTLPADDPKLSQLGVAAAIPAAIAAGIRYAVNHGATVIDLPIDPGQPGTAGTGGAAAAAGGSAAERAAVAYALQHNVVLVAPAGDDGAGSRCAQLPGCLPRRDRRGRVQRGV